MELVTRQLTLKYGDYPGFPVGRHVIHALLKAEEAGRSQSRDMVGEGSRRNEAEMEIRKIQSMRRT